MTRLPNLLWRLWTRVHRIVRMAAGRSALNRMQKPDATDAALASALSAVLEGVASDEERAWIGRIETLRAHLAASTESIPDVHFGAARPPLGPDATVAIGNECRQSATSPVRGLLLFRLVRTCTPVSCVELGTNLGISSAYLGAALALNGSGRLVTIEGSPALARRAEAHLQQLGLGMVSVVVGSFQEVLDDVLVAQEPLGLVFVDGHHEERATLEYFARILPHLGDRALLVLDDIHWSRGMARAWKRIAAHERVSVSVDLFDAGICVVENHPPGKRYYRVVLR